MVGHRPMGDGGGGDGGNVLERTPMTMRDPRRSRNIRTGLLLAAVAASFFVLILLKYGWYGR